MNHDEAGSIPRGQLTMGQGQALLEPQEPAMAPLGALICVQIRSVYGRELIYPMNAAGHAAVKLTGRKTFIRADLQALRELGYRIEQVSETINID